VDSELVSDFAVPSDEGEFNSLSSSITYTEIFYKQFPYYLSIGMTPEQYWDGDASLPKYYRQADAIKFEKMNRDKWIQGLYVYEAICDASPILRSFGKKGDTARPYPSEPYPLTEKQRKKSIKDKEKETSEKGLQLMKSLMKSTNKKFKADV